MAEKSGGRGENAKPRGHVLSGTYFFDHKPVIMKAWPQDMDFEKEEIRSLPIWIQVKIDLKY